MAASENDEQQQLSEGFAYICYKTVSQILLKEPIKGATKLYFKYCFCVVIILFSTGLYKSAFFIYGFGKI